MKRSYPIWHPFTQMKTASLLPVSSAKGLFLHLEDGRKLMDLISSWWVNIHGHAHPLIARALYEQAKQLEHVIFANFSHTPSLELVKKLQKHLPKNLKHFFFSDNGSTAVEIALKMAHQYWKNLGESSRKTFICFEGAYHGDTFGAMSASAKSSFTLPFEEFLFDVFRLPFPETFENDLFVEEKEKKSLESFSKFLEKNKPIALLIEPLVQGASGMRMCRPEFLQKLENLAKKASLPIIYDEVMVGFGRTGEFFACTKAKTSPDIICLSKGLTGGFLPLALTVCSSKIYDTFYSLDPKKTFFHGHSYTGNPLSCAAAIASLSLLEKEKKFETISHESFVKKFEKIPQVEKVRTCGTIAAFDLRTSDPGYHSSAAKKLQTFCLKKNLFLRPLGNVFYLMPPYCITKRQLRFVYQTIEEFFTREKHS